MKEMDEKILEKIKNSAEDLEIPAGIRPEQIKKRLAGQDSEKMKNKKRTKSPWKVFGALAAGLCLVVGAGAVAKLSKMPAMNSAQGADDGAISGEIASAEMTYEDIYCSMKSIWDEDFSYGVWFGDDVEGEKGIGVDGVRAEATVTSGAADLADSINGVSESFGGTNVQTEGVEEADIVKNDGRYLYQIVWADNGGTVSREIQLIDTEQGLTEVARIGGFQNIDEFYVWKDTLVVIENKYLYETEAYVYDGLVDCYVGSYPNKSFHEISFYNISDRKKPEKIKTFTLQGAYESSRISEGYFYGFSKYYASPGEGEKDYDAYVPVLDGEYLRAEDIYLGEDNKETSYLVLVSIDLENPEKFVQTAGIVTGADLYYVSKDNIYVTDVVYGGTEEGWNCDKTELIKFSYDSGEFLFEAKGEIKGVLENSFSLDEYENHLRAVTTVREYELKTVVDDRTGEVFGAEISNEKQTNALYVLDENLQLVGQIEGLAENEQIYSARFMGEVGYFVTFRQTDPLFTVDLGEPANPKIMSELKVTGFSEYLHLYSEGRLLGIGMEADEETGWQEGMKLSMFDVSDPGDVQEISKLSLEEYDYSEALYNHRAVMISTEKNLFGFAAEGSERGEYWKRYLVFSYEEEAFVLKLQVEAQDEEGRYDAIRGTFIGDTFYLLKENGTVKSYDLNSGELIESLGP